MEAILERAAAPIVVERDANGLRSALRELFEEAFLQEAMSGMMADADEETRERAMGDIPGRTLSPGYYDRASYLLDLASSIETGVSYSAATLAESDVSGIRSVQAAKSEFEREHPPCGHCGARQYSRFDATCRSCNARLRGKAVE